MEQNKTMESFLTISELWRLCLARWRWFVVSVALCLAMAIRYLMVTPYLYTRYAAIMLREESLGANVTDKNGSDFNQIGFVTQKSNVTDAVRHITSLDILLEVARRLDPSLSFTDRFDLARDLQDRLSAETEGTGSYIIDLTFKDYSTASAEHVLNTIIEVYNSKWIESKQKAIETTSRFIDTRLRLIEEELNVVDDSISTFKSRWGITDLAHVSDVYLQQQSSADSEILRLTNEKAMAEYIRSLLDGDDGGHELLLVNSGINNSLIESQITLYNSLLLQMQGHLDYTSDQNPLIINLERELVSLRKNIYANVSNHIRTLDIQLKSLSAYHGETTSKITSKPAQAKHLISIERDQKVKESLYMYLLQKKEENEISLTYKTAPSQIIDMPNGSGKPTSPNRIIVLMGGVLLGVLFPLTLIFLRATFDESVRDRRDIECNSDIPVLGELPWCGSEDMLSRVLQRFGVGKQAKSSGIVVGADMLNASNEAFRVLRNNMSSIDGSLTPGGGGRVYLMKSNGIDVGKTFVGMNLALTKGIGGERVLFVDGDLRQGTASRLWDAPSVGLTDYLSGAESDFQRLLWHPEGSAHVDVLPAGALPTNPTELLSGGLLAELMARLRCEYECIIIDSPAAGILADADILEGIADCTLLVVRAGRFDRHRLNEMSSTLAAKDGSARQYFILNGVSMRSHYGYAYSQKYQNRKEPKTHDNSPQRATNTHKA